ncbi:hypothetical protein OS493_023314 [Desmophyllum pertusum]|uniref:Uncharacterized protein n=1 Tax=Desmophyllum pertusum TaxID=174260 RepID=A0A9W9YAG3_9CNID|nr:hypothetical protein OS493_023314 [Desmophyllum pertusum]
MCSNTTVDDTLTHTNSQDTTSLESHAETLTHESVVPNRPATSANEVITDSAPQFRAVRSTQMAERKRKEREQAEKRQSRQPTLVNSEHSRLPETLTPNPNQRQVHFADEIQSTGHNNSTSNSLEINTINVPQSIASFNAEKDILVSTLDNNSVQYSRKQLLIADEYKTRQENNEDISKCDYNSHETPSSEIIENTSVTESQKVTVYPANISFARTEQDTEITRNTSNIDIRKHAFHIQSYSNNSTSHHVPVGQLIDLTTFKVNSEQVCIPQLVHPDLKDIDFNDHMFSNKLSTSNETIDDNSIFNVSTSSKNVPQIISHIAEDIAPLIDFSNNEIVPSESFCSGKRTCSEVHEIIDKSLGNLPVETQESKDNCLELPKQLENILLNETTTESIVSALKTRTEAKSIDADFKRNVRQNQISYDVSTISEEHEFQTNTIAVEPNLLEKPEVNVTSKVYAIQKSKILELNVTTVEPQHNDAIIEQPLVLLEDPIVSYTEIKMETVQLKTIEPGQDTIVASNNKHNEQTLDRKYNKLTSKCSIKRLISEKHAKFRLSSSNLNKHISEFKISCACLRDELSAYRVHSPFDIALTSFHDNPNANTRTADQYDLTAPKRSDVCFETADSSKFSTNETTANQHDLAAPTSSNVCFDDKVKQEQSISLQDSIQFTQTTSNCSNLDENLACSIDIDATSSSFKSNSWRETPLLTKHPPVFNEKSAIQLMSGQNALINGDQLLNSQPNSPAITQGLPPPYTYKICRKRKPPDKV